MYQEADISEADISSMRALLMSGQTVSVSGVRTLHECRSADGARE